MSNHILGDDDSDDELGTFTTHPPRRRPPSQIQPFSRQHPQTSQDPFSPTEYDPKQTSLSSQSYFNQSSNPTHEGYHPESPLQEEDERWGVFDSDRKHQSSSTYASGLEQNQNPAAYSGGNPSNPLGTMQDLSHTDAPPYRPFFDDVNHVSPAHHRNLSASSAGAFASLSGRNRLGMHQADSVESGFPFSSAGVPPAGLPTNPPQISKWALEDDYEDEMAGIRNIPLVDAPGGQSRKSGNWGKQKAKAPSLKERIEDLFSRKPKELAGERFIYLNDVPRNEREFKYMSNYVSTTKYNMVTFLPKFLLGSSFNIDPILIYISLHCIWSGWLDQLDHHANPQKHFCFP